MAHTVIAAVGDNMDSLFVGIREFPTKRIILIASEEKLDLAEKTKKDLEKFKVIDQIVDEPAGGAHLDWSETASFIKSAILKQLKELMELNPETLVEQRIRKYTEMGFWSE